MRILRSISGSSTIFAIIVATSIMVSSIFVFNSVISNDKFTSSNVGKVKATYEAEGFIMGQVNLTKQFIAQTDDITTNRLRAFITPHISTLTPSGFSVQSWDVSVENTSSVRNLPSGPFNGMQSEVRNVNFKVTLTSNVTGAQTSAELDGTIAGITFTQFGVFSFHGWTVGTIVNRILMSGRVFANSSITMGSSQGNVANAHLGTDFLAAPYVTSASSINLYPPVGGQTLRSFIAADDSGTNFRELKSTAVSGCTNCDGTGLDWKEYALSRWNGRVQDRYHNVPRINIKTAVPPRVQAYNTPERLLIDPVVTADHESVKQAKFAYRADIRIINGVWYLKNPNDETAWPGIPVWSDHPGSFYTTNEETTEGVQGVGQSDIATNLATNFPLHTWPANTTPKKFSYYEYDRTNQQIFDNDDGVISYGNLIKSSGLYIPGGYATNNIAADKSSFCYDSAAVPAAFTQCTGVNCGTDLLIPITSSMACLSGADSGKAHRIVNATRSGYRFGLWQNHSQTPTAARVGRSKIYPMNFDLERFKNALGCTYDPANPLPGQDHPGELGCYFTTWGLMRRSFNGIVYITSTWAGSLNGLKDLNYPVAPPFAHNDTDSRFFGTSDDTNQTPVHHAAQSRALPMQLCSNDLAGNNLDAHGAFKVPNCNRYQNLNDTNQIRPRITALRLVNGANLTEAAFPKGLSIVSNLHTYIQGDLNTTSVVTTSTSTPWIPLLVAGDDIILFSNSWEDHNARWDINTNVIPRLATNTTYNVALMKYWAHLLLNEDWRTRTLRINGPQILSHYSIYPGIVENYSTGLGTWYSPASEQYRYDPHFQYILNQPPGVPFISVFATSGWRTK